MNTVYNENVTGMILAGGKARRMGGIDKGLIKINGQAMIQYVLDVLKPQVKQILINANRNVSEYKKFGYPVISDQLEDFQGPLAGIAASMEVAKTKYICTCPCDGPLIARDLISRLFSEVSKTNDIKIAVAHDGKRLQPVYALIDCELLTNLIDYLKSGERKIDRWYTQHNFKAVDFSDRQDCFININTPEDQQTISQQLATK
ncbi:MAG: molybdenum cofactor guanylyltransferase MobA [Gammaproteobacteria bacterium]|nr:molybdenum cofactor guanylyltransferase MobA [Gammaproteobacteria bacterium]